MSLEKNERQANIKLRFFCVPSVFPRITWAIEFENMNCRGLPYHYVQLPSP